MSPCVNVKARQWLHAAVVVAAAGLFACGGRHRPDDADNAAPPPPVVEHENESADIRVEHPERFPLATAAAHEAVRELTVTGVVNADVARNVPVVSLAAGRVVELRARLGDRVQKGQLLMRIQSAEVAAAYADFRKASADRALADHQLERARVLLDRGAIARKDAEVAEDAADKARIDVENAVERLRVLGADADRPPASIIDVVAPVSGVITEQNVTNAAGVRSLDNSPNLFTISDLSRVWIVCDVYENDLPTVVVGDTAEIRLAAYPDRVLYGRVDNIGAILDPAIRTAKVRLEVDNPGLLRIGMFVTAAFHGRESAMHVVVPAASVLHLHDRDWVWVSTGGGHFERREVKAGKMLAGDLQEIRAGLAPSERIVANALVLQNSVEQ